MIEKKEKIKKKKKSIKGSFFLDGILIALGLYFCVFFGYNAANPDVSVYEGYFSREYTRGGFMIKAYVFTNGEGKTNPTFYLDRFSKKEMYPDEFAEGVRYRIYYEEDANIIMRVEVCEEQEQEGEDGSSFKYHTSLHSVSTTGIATLPSPQTSNLQHP